jgi:inosine/xanthosine triphosphate pyrophosphatase family protein
MTSAQLTDEVKNHLSHRGQAAEQAKDLLKELT